MAVVGLRIAHTANDREPLVCPKLRQAFACRVESQLVVEVKHVGGCVGEIRPCVVIGAVAVRDNRVDTVVAAVERDDDQDASPLGQRPFLRGPAELGPRDRDGPGQQAGRADTGAGDQEFAAIDLRHLESLYEVRYSGVFTAAATS